MQRSAIILFSTLLFCLFLLPAAAQQTGWIVLKDRAKQGPTVTMPPPPEQQLETSRKGTSTSHAPPQTLGKYRSIEAVKRRISAPDKSVRLPRIAKQISSKCVMVMDASSGKTLYARAPDTPRQPASTIKVLTGAIALKILEKEDKVSVSSKASKMPRSKIYLDTRKDYLATDLIDAVLLASANDASVALAEKIAGDEKKFAYMMTLRAKLWGARQTICKTASGLTAKGQQSTARDLANIFRHAMQVPEFAERMKQRKVESSDGKTFYNHNKALWQVKGALGGKTGYTAAARQTYVGQFSRDGESIVVAIMGSETMWSDVKKLVDYGFKKKKQLQLAQAEAQKQLAATLH